MTNGAPFEGAPRHEAREHGSSFNIASDEFAQDLDLESDDWPPPAVAAAACFVALAHPGCKLDAFKMQCIALGEAIRAGEVKAGPTADGLIEIARSHGLDQQFGVAEIEGFIRWGFEMPPPSGNPPTGGLLVIHEIKEPHPDEYGPPPDWGEPPANAKPVRFPLTRFDDVVYEPTREYFVPRKALFLVYGPTSSGKSFWSLDLAMHIALGSLYRGRPLLQGPVVYVAAEGTGGFAKRIEAFKRRHGGAGAPLYLCSVRPDLIADYLVLIANIRDQLKGQQPVAVIIDTVNRSLTGSESKDADMARYLNAAGKIVDEFQCAVILVHHSGLEAGRPRGHTSLAAAADVMVAIEPGEPDLVLATVEKSKDGPSGEQILSRLEVVEVGRDEDGKPVTSCVVVPVDDLPPQKKSARKLSARDELARRALVDLIAESDIAAPSVAPIGAKAVKVDDWRDGCYSRGIVEDGAKPNTRRQAFKRAKDQLQLYAIIAERDGLVWLTKPEADR